MPQALSHVDELYQSYLHYQELVNELENEDAIRQDVSYLYGLKEKRDYYKDEYQGYLNTSSKSLYKSL